MRHLFLFVVANLLCFTSRGCSVAKIKHRHVAVLELLIFLLPLACTQELLWSEEFDFFDTNTWEYNVGAGGWGNREIQEYRQENVRVQDGKLIITVREEEDGTITSGRIYSKADLPFEYGRIEVSIKFPTMTDGLWPAFWMLGSNFPDKNWPAAGTVTVAQVGSGRTREQGISIDRNVGSAVIWEADNGRTESVGNEITTTFDLTTEFSTYQVEWTPEYIITSVSGIEILNQDISACECQELHQPFDYVINVAVGGTYTGIFERSEVHLIGSAELEIDYIRVYNNSHSVLRHSMPTYATSMPTYVTSMPTYENWPTYADMPNETPDPTLIPPSMAPVVTDQGSPSSSSTINEPPTPSPVTPESTPFPVTITSAPTITPTPTEVTPVAVVDTPVPTNSPSSPPTPFPTDSPSLPQTKAPTTPAPTDSPTFRYTDESTTSLTDHPTALPTSIPSTSPSSYPSMSPTVPPLQMLRASGSTMKINGINPLDSARTLTWKKVTIEHLRRELPDVLEGGQLVDLSVTLTGQNPPYVARRHLQTSTTQELTFDTAVSVKSARDDLDVNGFVDKAFQTNEQQAAYLEELAKNDGFANAESLSMVQGPSASQVQAPADVDDGVDTSGAPFIVGIAVAGVAAIAVLGFFVYLRRRRRRTFSGTTTAKSPKNIMGTRVSAPPSTFTSHIEPADEDSLYDFNLEVPLHSSRDGGSVFTSNSSVTIPYDDQVAFQKESMYASSEGTGWVTEPYVADPDDQFYRYTVEAPPGLLGMTLETSALDGTPSVYGIKNTSPLASDVQVGDRLISVDGLDVSEMDATAVSRLIAGKKTNRYRQLVFIRPDDDDDLIPDVEDPD